MHLEQQIEDLANARGVSGLGFAACSRLPDLPSADPSFLLPGARSLVSLMVHYDPEIVERFLSGRDRDAMQHHEAALYQALQDGAQAVARQLRDAGHQAVAAEPNLDYRYKTKPAYRRVPHGIRQGLVDWLARDGRRPLGGAKRALVPLLYRGPLRVRGWRLTPSFAHRYGAVAAGLGTIGWSGNVLHPEHGARVLFTTVLTSAELTQSPMLEEQPCDRCRLCERSCQSGFIHREDAVELEIGGRSFEHNRKASNLRCVLVCGGFSGQSRFPGWSTGSRGRVTLPADDGDLQACWDALMLRSLGRASHGSETFATMAHHAEYGFVRRPVRRFEATCGYCQHVCAADRKERAALYRAITSKDPP